MTLGLATAAIRRVNRVVEPIVKSGITSLLPVGPALVVVETVGRRSHRLRDAPVLALRFGSKVFLSTVRGDSHWLANVDATPSAAVWLGGSRRTGDAAVHHNGFIDVASIVVDPVGDAPSR